MRLIQFMRCAPGANTIRAILTLFARTDLTHLPGGGSSKKILSLACLFGSLIGMTPMSYSEAVSPSNNPPVTASAEDNQKQTTNLSDIFALAVNNDAEWSSFLNTIKARQEILTQSRAGLLPSADFTAFTRNTDRDTEGGFDPLTSPGSQSDDIQSHAYTLNATQPLLRLDRWFAFKRDQSSYSRLDAERNAEYQAFILRVATAYFDVLRSQESLSFAEAEVSAISRQLDQTQQRFKVGLIAITDVHEAQAAFDLAQVALIAAEADVAVAKENLDAITGQPTHALTKPSEELPITVPNPETMEAWIIASKENNPALKASQLAEEIARRNKQIQRSQYAPSIDLFATYTDASDTFSESPTDIESDTESTTIGLELAMPLFRGGATRSANREAAFDYLAAKDNTTFERRRVIRNAKNLFRIVKTDVLRVKARNQTIISSQSALDATEAGYEVGTRNIVDVLQAQRSLFAAKRDYANARYDYILNRLQLYQNAGRLNTGHLDELSRWMTGNT